ncbi:MAG: DUF2807 domain-containing protein [Eubacteriales bacterium]
MKKLSLAAALIILLAAALPSCGLKATVNGDKNVLPRTYTLDPAVEYTLDLTGIELGEVFGADGGRIPYTVSIDPTLADTMVITTDENIFSSLEITLEGNAISVHGGEGSSYLPSEFDITFGCEVVSLDADGALDINLSHASASPLEITLAGAVSANVAADRMASAAFKLSGAADIAASGVCSYLTAELSGAASLDALKLDSENADVSAAGASSAKVNVSGKLNGSVDGAAEIRYTGSPDVTSSASGTGSILPLE